MKTIKKQPKTHASDSLGNSPKLSKPHNSPNPTTLQNILPETPKIKTFLDSCINKCPLFETNSLPSFY